MTYAELKHKLISLGFAEESDYEEFEELGYTYDAINLAVSLIADIFPAEAKYEFEIDETDEGYIYVDMSARPGFLELAETPVLFEKDGEDVFRKFSDYQIEMDHTLVINAENKGSIRIYYVKQCTQVNENTPDTFVFEIPLKVHHLIPLLAAYYLWLDDDERKATQYYNQYEAALATALQKKNQPRMRVVADGRDI